MGVWQMTFNMYHYTGERTVLHKQLSDPTVKTGSFRGEYDVLNPVLTLNGSYDGCNYCEIDGRYYFVDSINQERTGIFTLQLHIDVLMTYQAAIDSLPAIVGRSPAWNNANLPDPDWTRQQNTQAFCVPVGSPFTYMSDGDGLAYDRYILTTVG